MKSNWPAAKQHSRARYSTPYGDGVGALQAERIAADLEFRVAPGGRDRHGNGDGKNDDFKAVILNVYKAGGGVCQKISGTMQP